MLAHCIVDKVLYYKSGISQYEAFEFSECKDSFETVAETLRRIYLEELADKHVEWCTVETYDETWIFSCIDFNGKKFTYEYSQTIENEILAMRVVDFALSRCADSSERPSITIDKDQISFISCTQANYSIIRTVGIMVPKHIHSSGKMPSLYDNMYCDRLGLYWFQACYY